MLGTAGHGGGAETWRPTASLEHLRARARLLARIRDFFAGHGVLEVDTPALSATTVTDPHIASLGVATRDGRYYLQTSPEYAMKRLLAAYGVPIYQVCKAFRDGERGTRHNPELTLLEWYQPGYDHHRLMDELEDLIETLLGRGPITRKTYRQVFRGATGIDPWAATVGELRAAARECGLGGEAAVQLGRDACLELIFSYSVEPALDPMTFVYDYPASQAALARIRPGEPPLAERFELFIDGLELANGYHELADPREQGERFAADLRLRAARGDELPRVDRRLLAALEVGLPDCAGVAVGIERLLMVAVAAGHIDEVLALPWARA